jgi:carbamoyl-phosphate synthase small subunit
MSSDSPTQAILALEDGTWFRGTSVGAQGEAFGEIVFNTSMTGYQEILTDPSYCGQIVAMTYPLIGNYGCNDKDVESRRSFVQGFVMRECCKVPSNWRATMSLPEYLEKNNVIAVDGVDTRALTRHIRIEGAMKSVISTADDDPESLVEKARKSTGIVGQDLVKEVTCDAPYEWTDDAGSDPVYKVVAIDTGVKYNILRSLTSRGCRVTVVPATTSADDILAMDPDGIFLSNGPGDPEVQYVIETVRSLLGKKPIFGICLGHQMLGLALDGQRFKLKFGHRGANQPVKNFQTGRTEITSQNHGFAIAAESLDPDMVEHTHINLNDQTLEGMRHKEISAFSVQYHPEASPGPHDSRYLFADFVAAMEKTGS